MRKALKQFLLAFMFSACLFVPAEAIKTIDINSLVTCAETYDNQTVTVEGEAIGEVLDRGDYAWVNINDGTNAIGIWMTVSEAETIENFGDYKHIGDTLKITGVFSRNCTEHGGDVDIHCASMEITKSGYRIDDKVSSSKAVAASVLLCSALIIVYIYFKVLKRLKP